MTSLSFLPIIMEMELNTNNKFCNSKQKLKFGLARLNFRHGGTKNLPAGRQGCYYQEQMNPSDYKFDENHSIQVNTRDTVYHFNGNNYLLKNDTLFAKAKNRIGRRTQLTNVIIPIEEVETVEVDRIDAAKTTLLVIGVVGIIVTIGALTFDPFPDDDSSFFK